MHLYKTKKGIPAPGIILTIVIFVVVAGILYGQIKNMSKEVGQSDVDMLKDALENAVVTCYAIEGRYPESLEYIEEHYGVKIDGEKYFVDYNKNLINMKPQISVYTVESQ